MSTSMNAVIRFVYGLATIRFETEGSTKSAVVRDSLNQASGVVSATERRCPITLSSSARSLGSPPRAAHLACSRSAKVSHAGSTPWAISVGRYHSSSTTGSDGGDGWGWLHGGCSPARSNARRVARASPPTTRATSEVPRSILPAASLMSRCGEVPAKIDSARWPPWTPRRSARRSTGRS